MKNVYKGIYLSILVVLSLNSQSIEQRKNIICLLDFSESISSKMNETYIQVLMDNVVPNMKQYDQLTILPIDQAAKMTPTKIIDEDLSKKVFKKRTDPLTHSKDSIRRRLDEYLHKLMKKIEYSIQMERMERIKLGWKTDILGAIQQTEELLETKEDNESLWKNIQQYFSKKPKIVIENIVLIFSDMIHETEKYNFNVPSKKPEGCPPNSAIKIIGELKANGELPEMKGAKIIVFGRTGFTNIQVDNNENFWRKLFRAENANLLAYGYDTRRDITNLLSSRDVDVMNKPNDYQDDNVSVAVNNAIDITDIQKTFSGTMSINNSSQFVIIKISEVVQNSSKTLFKYTLNSGGFRKDAFGEYLGGNYLLLTPENKCTISKNLKGKIQIRTIDTDASIQFDLNEN